MMLQGIGSIEELCLDPSHYWTKTNIAVAYASQRTTGGHKGACLGTSPSTRKDIREWQVPLLGKSQEYAY